MKKLILLSFVLVAGAFLYSQTIQLPGIGSTAITVSSSQINAASQLTFGNPEYNIIAFQVSFATNSNPTYSANSADNHFTSDMLANIPQMVNGTGMQLQVTLKAPQPESASWQKSYTVQLTD